MQSITLAGGCFWCLDAAYRQLKGIKSSVCGYTGGHTLNPTYDQVILGTTGHAEAVQITYDSKLLDEADVLNVFWILHDPTSLNKQGADSGTQYRSEIFYNNNEQRIRAEKSRNDVQEIWDRPIVTKISHLTTFYPAEGYHQNYFANNPDQGYCQVVINPKLLSLRQKFAQLLIDDSN